MNSKLFISTFVLIFLAELGDKTQLAAMARVAGGEGGKWTVFLAASSALVVSTLIAVLLGSGIQKLGLPEAWIRGVAGVMFIILGFVLVASAWRPERRVPAPAPVEAPVATVGGIAALVLRVAAEFERSAAADYDAMARQAADPHCRRVFAALAAEERGHIERIVAAATVHGETALAGEHPAGLPGVTAAATDDNERSVVNSAIQHEEATAAFYEALAGATRIPALRAVFATLAAEERGHVRQLNALFA